jgi:hypothetical protein
LEILGVFKPNGDPEIAAENSKFRTIRRKTGFLVVFGQKSKISKNKVKHSFRNQIARRIQKK